VQEVKKQGVTPIAPLFTINIIAKHVLEELEHGEKELISLDCGERCA